MYMIKIYHAEPTYWGLQMKAADNKNWGNFPSRMSVYVSLWLPNNSISAQNFVVFNSMKVRGRRNVARSTLKQKWGAKAENNVEKRKQENGENLKKKIKGRKWDRIWRHDVSICWRSRKNDFVIFSQKFDGQFFEFIHSLHWKK